MFNLSGSEIVVILLLALIVLGPEKLPDAIRRFGRIYGELRKMGTGFQSEFRNAFDEPLKELRETAQLTRDAVMNPIDQDGANQSPIDQGLDDVVATPEPDTTASHDTNQQQGPDGT